MVSQNGVWKVVRNTRLTAFAWVMGYCIEQKKRSIFGGSVMVVSSEAVNAYDTVFGLFQAKNMVFATYR
jgi:hypothetical protein